MFEDKLIGKTLNPDDSDDVDEFINQIFQLIEKSPICSGNAQDDRIFNILIMALTKFCMTNYDTFAQCQTFCKVVALALIKNILHNFEVNDNA